MKILIVEDEEVLVKVLQEKFEKENFTVKLVTDGELVLKLVKSFKPDLILLDIILPKKNGLEVLKELKSDPELQNIPVAVFYCKFPDMIFHVFDRIKNLRFIFQ